MECPMYKFSIAAIALFSTQAFATDARVNAFQSNAGLTDETDYRRYFARTDNGKASMWFDIAEGQAAVPEAGAGDPADPADPAAAPPAIGPQGGVLSATYKADGRSMRIEQNTAGSSDMSYYAADGDTGYMVMLRAINKDNVTVGGGYGITSGKSDMAYGGAFTKGEDNTDITAYIQSRDLTKSEVTAYGANLAYQGKNIIIDGAYDMGWRFKTDRSRAAVTLGPRAGITKPEEGDMAIDLTLAQINIAGEFAINDWFGLRGSVVSALDANVPMGDEEFDIMTAPVTPAFGASIDFEGVDIDFTISPDKVMDGPFFLTGAGVGEPFAASMSARFDI